MASLANKAEAVNTEMAGADVGNLAFLEEPVPKGTRCVAEGNAVIQTKRSKILTGNNWAADEV